MEHAFPLDGFQSDNRTTFSIFQLYRGLRCRPIEVTCSFFNVYRWQVSSFQLIAVLWAQYYGGTGNWYEKRNGLKFSCFLSTPYSWNKERWSHLPFASCAFNFCLIATVRVQILEIKLTVRVRLLPQKFTLALLQAMTPFCLIISGDKAKRPRW